jgi:hypothetical protein
LITICKRETKHDEYSRTTMMTRRIAERDRETDRERERDLQDILVGP